MKIRGVVSAVFPVSGSTAVMSNWLRPRRRSTSLLHLPAASAETRYGSSRPAAVIVIVAPGDGGAAERVGRRVLGHVDDEL
jgi:hypothetical protein